MTTSTEPYDESVQELVARENARRKRVFLAFLALLLVPIAIGAYALTRAPSETAKVAKDVAPIVTERVGGQIAARVTSEVVSRAEPIIRESVAREITAKVEPRIASVASDLRHDITDLQTASRETASFVAAARPQMTSLQAFDDRLGKLSGTIDQTGSAFQSLRADQDRLRQEVAAQREYSQGLSKTIDQVRGQANNDVASSRQQFAELRQTMSKELESILALANTSVQTANANKEAIGAIARRLSVLEAEMKKLQERAANKAEGVPK
jgi:valyl-tRNA synthetase